MRIPPYYRHHGWQRFLSGVTIGMIIGFIFFLTLYGLAQERQIDKINQQATQIDSLERNRKTLLEDQDIENKKLEKKLTVQDVKVNIIDKKDKIDRIVEFELEAKVKEQLNSLLNNDIESVSTNKELIYKAIEDHPFVIDKTPYHFAIQNLVIYSVIEVDIRAVDPEDGSSKE